VSGEALAAGSLRGYYLEIPAASDLPLTSKMITASTSGKLLQG
jgi:hypothetical protein